jgi:hypothetical protein
VLLRVQVPVPSHSVVTGPPYTQAALVVQQFPRVVLPHTSTQRSGQAENSSGSNGLNGLPVHVSAAAPVEEGTRQQ